MRDVRIESAESRGTGRLSSRSGGSERPLRCRAEAGGQAAAEGPSRAGSGHATEAKHS